jgi:hypothetical protein
MCLGLRGDVDAEDRAERGDTAADPGEERTAGDVCLKI